MHPPTPQTPPALQGTEKARLISSRPGSDSSSRWMKGRSSPSTPLSWCCFHTPRPSLSHNSNNSRWRFHSTNSSWWRTQRASGSGCRCTAAPQRTRRSAGPRRPASTWRRSEKSSSLCVVCSAPLRYSRRLCQLGSRPSRFCSFSSVSDPPHRIASHRIAREEICAKSAGRSRARLTGYTHPQPAS